jgi:hypothetical protein
VKAKFRQDRAWLLATAKAVAERLKLHSDGTRLRVRPPRRVVATNTDGWRAVIGDIGKEQPRLEIWLDRFSGYSDRKLFAGFCSETTLTSLTKRVSRKLWPSRVITPNDLVVDQGLMLATRLGRSEFNLPIIEKYPGSRTFYGVYDPTRGTADRLNRHFCARAAAFFEDMARALPHATVDDEQREVYPQFENRKQVVSHLHRERSRLLATELQDSR